MKEPAQPLAEVFGYLTSDQTAQAERYRKRRLCPFNNKVPNCTNHPLGMCSINCEKKPMITCPIRFREDWIITDDAASFFFDEGATWSSLTEVRLNDAQGKSAGNIDVVLVAYDANGKVYDFGALEIQKRLAPHLLFKGGILNNWKKKTAVALNKGVFETLPPMKELSRTAAEIAWLIYDLKSSQDGTYNELFLQNVHYTERPDAPAGINFATGVPVDNFLRRLDAELEAMVV